MLKEDEVLKITEVRIRKLSVEGKLKAYATVTFDDCFVVHNIKIIDGKAGLFIAMPSRQTSTGGYRDIAHPINPDVRKMFEDAILEAYNKA